MSRQAYEVMMETRSESVFSKLFVLFTLICAIYITAINLGLSVYTSAWLYALLVLPVCTVLLFVSVKINILPAAFAITVFVIAFLIKGSFAYLVDTKPISDFGLFYNYAVELMQGKKALDQYFYFKTWAYQTGPVLYYAGIMKVFGTGLLALKLVNCFFMAASNMFIYLIARKVSNDFTARFVALLYLAYPAPYLLTSVLTNQHFAACMFLAGIYVLFLQNIRLITKGIISAVLIAVGNAIRPIGIVIVTAIVLWCIVEALSGRGKGRIILSALLVTVYIASCVGLSTLVRDTGINSEGLDNNLPLWKFVVGLNQESKGQFSFEDQKNIFEIKNFSERNSVALKTVKERLSVEPHKLLTLMGTKFNIMWADFDTLMWSSYKEKDRKLEASEKIAKIEPIVLRIEKMFYIGVFILLVIGLVRALRGRNITSETLLLSMVLLCYFGVHLLIEIQVRYRYFAMLIVFILAATGCEILLKLFKSYKKSGL